MNKEALTECDDYNIINKKEYSFKINIKDVIKEEYDDYNKKEYLLKMNIKNMIKDIKIKDPNNDKIEWNILYYKNKNDNMIRCAIKPNNNENFIYDCIYSSTIWWKKCKTSSWFVIIEPPKEFLIFINVILK